MVDFNKFYHKHQDRYQLYLSFVLEHSSIRMLALVLSLKEGKYTLSSYSLPFDSGKRDAQWEE